MRRMQSACVMVFATLATVAPAWSGDYYLAMGGGSAQVQLKPELLLQEYGSGEEEFLELHLALGARWQNAYAQVELGSTFLNSMASGAFGVDDYSLTSLRLSAGYDLVLASRWSVGPELSLTRAGFSAKEGRLFNPGPEEKSSIEDLAIGWGLQSKIRLSDRSLLKLRYTQADFDFGETRLASAGIEFSF